MLVLMATYRNGVIELQEPLPAEFEGKQIQIQVEEIEPVEEAEPVEVAKSAPKNTYRQAGSATGKIWMSPDFDEPLEDFKDYME